jgi:hypothetical protein
VVRCAFSEQLCSSLRHLFLYIKKGGGVLLMKRLHDMLRAGGVRVIMSKCVQVQHALVAQDRLGI